jgi:TPP-dependent pyruvate/acetoin dehydrogenase alpha subunit
VKFLEAQLLAENAITVDEIEAMKEEARVEALDAVHFADHSLSPTIEDVTKHVYWELDHQTAAASHGVHLFE